MIKIRKYKKIFTQGIKVIKYIYYLIYCKLFKNKASKYSNFWIISETGTDAKDNGYVFFKYLKEKHPEINIKYIISNNSPDFNKIKALGDYILYGSREHYISFIKSPILISTHIMGFSPDAGLFLRLQRYNILRLNSKIVWLQHGVIGNYLSYVDTKYVNLSLVITSAERERNFLIEKNGFEKDVVKCTGLARFDNLDKLESKHILFMPTFRKHMLYMNDKEFVMSNYYKRINSLINNNSLISVLKKNNITMFFYIHPQFQKYLHLFNTKSTLVKFASINNYNVQELLINSCLLITDYSSVAFDFAYMDKPIIYYQFDYEDFRKNHYREGYFSYEKDGFGSVLYKEEDVIKEIQNNVQNKFKLDKNMLNKIDKFFSVRDKNNCERIYNEIIKLEGII